MTHESRPPPCPLCKSKAAEAYFQDKRRAYLCCPHCDLVFVPDNFQVSTEEEKAIYELHDNTPQDMGYRAFLSRLFTPLHEKVMPHHRGLDFGCGPGPTLSVMFEEAGHPMDLFDPFFHNDPSVFSRRYDFITATEVVEHLHDPGKEFSTLFAMLNPGGWLGVMTKMVIDQTAFSRWHYTHDPTHICFFSQSTFAYLAQRFDAELTIAAPDVVLLRKK